MRQVTIGLTFLAMALGGMATAPAAAQEASAQPFFAHDFVRTGEQGFGDRDNSQPWSMAWFRGKLYVGTGRATFCAQQATLEFFAPEVEEPVPLPAPYLGEGSESTHYPPEEGDVECTPDPHDLPLAAEIWTWDPATDLWERVYRSPVDVPIEGTDKLTARDMGYRGMVVFPEPRPDGSVQEVLYVSGVSTRGGGGTGFNGPVPPPRILRSEDGVHFEAVPQDPGTLLGDTMVSGFRNLLVHDGRLYVLGSVGLLGHGVILEAEEPWLGNDAFRQISPPGLTFFEIESWNGFLWAGTGVQPTHDDTPFSLMKVDTSGTPPYDFVTVIRQGGYARVPSFAVISLFPFRDRLYVGSDRELLRVNPDDTWDLVVGSPRTTPDGPKAPLSGMDIGFDNIFNIHMWRMGGDQGWLYVGTQDQSTKWRELAGLGSRLAPRMGFDLFATDDGWHFTAISRNGLGDRFNNGVRNFASTPFGFFLGGANHYYGMEIFRARAGVVAESEVEQRPTRSRLRMLRDSVFGEPAVSPDPPRSNVLRAPPQRLEVEMGPRGAVLSWEGAPYATRFRVFRDSGFGDPIALRSTRTAVRPTATGAWYFVDTAVFGRDTYHYQVVGEDPHGNASGVSNMARFPSRAPRVTFALLDELVPDAPSSVKVLLVSARAAAARGDLDLAATELQALRRLLAFPGVGLPAWRTEDIEMLIAKLQRRVSLAKVGAIRAEGLLE